MRLRGSLFLAILMTFTLNDDAVDRAGAASRTDTPVPWDEIASLSGIPRTLDLDPDVTEFRLTTRRLGSGPSPYVRVVRRDLGLSAAYLVWWRRDVNAELVAQSAVVCSAKLCVQRLQLVADAQVRRFADSLPKTTHCIARSNPPAPAIETSQLFMQLAEHGTRRDYRCDAPEHVTNSAPDFAAHASPFLTHVLQTWERELVRR
jgi:hypothetical protein